MSSLLKKFWENTLICNYLSVDKSSQLCFANSIFFSTLITHMAKPMKTRELHYLLILFLKIILIPVAVHLLLVLFSLLSISDFGVMFSL